MQVLFILTDFSLVLLCALLVSSNCWDLLHRCTGSSSVSTGAVDEHLPEEQEEHCTNATVRPPSCSSCTSESDCRRAKPAARESLLTSLCRTNRLTLSTRDRVWRRRGEHYDPSATSSRTGSAPWGGKSSDGPTDLQVLATGT